jgi:hypothetical protein
MLFSLRTSIDINFMTPNPSYEADSRSASKTLIVLVWDPKVWGSVGEFQEARELGWEKKCATLFSVTSDWNVALNPIMKVRSRVIYNLYAPEMFNFVKSHYLKLL